MLQGNSGTVQAFASRFAFALVAITILHDEETARRRANWDCRSAPTLLGQTVRFACMARTRPSSPRFLSCFLAFRAKWRRRRLR